MKKFLFAVAALATSLTASAQLWVGGSLGFGNQSYWNAEDTETTWSFAPTVGYALDDALEVGLEFGINGSKIADDKSFGLSIAPFARYTFLSEGDFSLFVQGKIKYGYNKKESSYSTTSGGVTTTVTSEVKGWNFGCYIQPGIKYALTDNFSIVSTFGSLYFYHNDPEKAGGATGQNSFGLSLTSGLSFGLFYTF